MKRNQTGLSIAIIAMLLASCSDSDSNRSLTPGSSEQVRDLAAVQSESAEPIAINDGAFVFTDTSETSDPIAVDP